jgi:hypothetical protein
MDDGDAGPGRALDGRGLGRLVKFYDEVLNRRLAVPHRTANLELRHEQSVSQTEFEKAGCRERAARQITTAS